MIAETCPKCGCITRLEEGWKGGGERCKCANHEAENVAPPEIRSGEWVDARREVPLVECPEDVNDTLAGVAATLRMRAEDASFQPSVVFLQRRLRLGYVKASRILPVVKRRADEESASTGAGKVRREQPDN